MPDDLKIPNDVGQYCEKAAAVLESSRRFLDGEIADTLAWPDATDKEYCTIPRAQIERTRDNLAKAVEFLDWLARHSGVEPSKR